MPIHKQINQKTDYRYFLFPVLFFLIHLFSVFFPKIFSLLGSRNLSTNKKQKHIYQFDRTIYPADDEPHTNSVNNILKFENKKFHFSVDHKSITTIGYVVSWSMNLNLVFDYRKLFIYLASQSTSTAAAESK